MDEYDHRLKEIASQYGADYKRVQIWDALTSIDDSDPEDYVEKTVMLLKESPFSVQEMSHILLFECGPVMFMSSPSEEIINFSPEFYVPRCLARQGKHRFTLSGDPNRIILPLHLLSPIWFDAYLLLGRVQRARKNGKRGG